MAIRAPAAWPPSAATQIPALTSIRGIAAWWVVLFHFGQVTPAGEPPALRQLGGHGYLAVDLFFQLSGFVIALNYAATLQEFRPRNMLHFLGLRLARIYPLHIFVLLLFLSNPIAIDLFSSQRDGGYRYDPGYFVQSVFLVQNWGFTSKLAWNVPAWSISTEWFAYIVFPLLVWTTQRSARGTISAAASIAVLLLTLAALTFMSGLGGDIETYGLPRCVLEFCTGIVLLRLHVQRARRTRLESNLCSLLAMTCFGVTALLSLPDYTLIPLGFALLIFAMADGQSAVSRCLALPILEWIGLVSYSTYLIHYFVRDWVKFLLVKPTVSPELLVVVYLGTTAVASIILYHFVEVPGRRAIRAFMQSALAIAPARNLPGVGA